MFKKLVIAVAAVVTMTTSAGAFNMGATRSMKPQIIRSSTAPMAYQIFCARFASECAAGGRGSISYNSSTAALIKKVNDSVNRTMRRSRFRSGTDALHRGRYGPSPPPP